MASGSSAISNLLFLVGLLIMMALVAVSTVRTGRLLRTWTPPFNPLLSLPENALRLGLIAASVGLGLVFGPGPAALGWRDRAHLAAIWLSVPSVGVALAGFFAVAGRAAVRRWGPEVYDDRVLRCILPVTRRERPGVALALLPAADAGGAAVPLAAAWRPDVADRATLAAVAAGGVLRAAPLAARRVGRGRHDAGRDPAFAAVPGHGQHLAAAGRALRDERVAGRSGGSGRGETAGRA